MDDNVSSERELGAIGAHLQAIDGKLGELVAYQKAQNGRLTKVESQVAVLEDRDETRKQEHASLVERLKEMETRARVWLIALGGPVAGSLVLVLTHHA